MKLPIYTDYQNAIQYPELAFKNDPDLKNCRVEKNPLGLPIVRSGNFAYIYKLIGTSQQQWAVRCFSKYVPDRQRYEAISRFINTNVNEFFVPTYYLNDGIFVNGKWFPIIKMQWKEGKTLGTFVERNVNLSHTINHILQQFQSLIKRLE